MQKIAFVQQLVPRHCAACQNMSMHYSTQHERAPKANTVLPKGAKCVQCNIYPKLWTQFESQFGERVTRQCQIHLNNNSNLKGGRGEKIWQDHEPKLFAKLLGV